MSEAVSSTLVAHEPGGCECESCGTIFIGSELDRYCPSCTEGRAQDDWDRRDAEGHDPDLDENNVCRVCGKYEPE